MALIYLSNVEGNKNGKDFIINTRNIKSVLSSGDMNNAKFAVSLMSGTVFDFNQIYYQGNFIFVYNMEQLYSLLTKIERGEIQGGSS